MEGPIVLANNASTAPPGPAVLGGLSDTTGATGSHVLAVSPDCINLIELDGRLRSMNEAGRCLMEIDDLGAVVGTQWVLSWPENARAKVSQAVAAASNGDISRFSDFCPTAKGTPKWWDVVVSPVRSVSGVVEHVLVISRDITPQKLVEDRLRNSEQRFRALADNIAQFAWMADATGHIFWYNQRWFDYTGTTLEEMKGWGWTKVHHPDHVERVVQKISAHFTSGEPWEDTFPLRGTDGAYRWFLSQAMPIRNEEDGIVLWCGTNTDITEQRAFSDRLRQKARLLELSHEAQLVWELSGGIVTWNRGCQELYGWTSEEAMGQRSHALLKTEHPLKVQDFEDRLRREGGWSGQLLHRSKDGTEVWVESRQELIDLGGRSLVLETNRDITARRKADELTRLLLGELDHRVKNTLAIVQSIASQTARRAVSLRSFTTSFNARLQSLANAHNLLTETRWSGADLRALVRSQLADAAGNDEQILLEGPEIFLPSQVALQLSLIVHELGANARKYGALLRPEGRVAIHWSLTQEAVPRLELDWVERGGPPVEPRGERGFGTTLIERTGSQPHLQAALDFNPEGVRCHVLADVADAKSPLKAIFDPLRRSPRAAGASAADARPIDAGRILIIEDEPLIAMDLEEIVTAQGYKIAGQAVSVETALNAIATQKPDIAIVDGSLQGEPVDAIVTKLAERNVPYVVVTGLAPANLPQEVRDNNVPILRKPAIASDLIAALRTVAARM
jgi:PAS domain S-box-containing protein